MASCDEAKLLLGPFEDGELEPHEMEDVALHVVSCQSCKAVLDGYRALGVALRDCLPQPDTNGFSTAVMRRLDEVPQSLSIRWRSYLETIGEYLGGTASLVAAGAFAALLTAWLAAPYVQHLTHSSSPIEVASRKNSEATGPAPNIAAQNPDTPPVSPMITLSNDPTTTVIWLPNQP